MGKLTIKHEYPKLSAKGVTAITGCGIVNKEQADYIANCFDKAIDKIDAKNSVTSHLDLTV